MNISLAVQLLTASQGSYSMDLFTCVVKPFRLFQLKINSELMKAVFDGESLQESIITRQ
jgi:hypothetical protein